jgi:hypothetical protein
LFVWLFFLMTWHTFPAPLAEKEKREKTSRTCRTCCCCLSIIAGRRRHPISPTLLTNRTKNW